MNLPNIRFIIIICFFMLIWGCSSNDNSTQNPVSNTIDNTSQIDNLPALLKIYSEPFQQFVLERRDRLSDLQIRLIKRAAKTQKRIKDGGDDMKLQINDMFASEQSVYWVIHDASQSELESMAKSVLGE